MNTFITRALAASSLVLVAGCDTGSDDAAIPKPAPTTAEVPATQPPVRTMVQGTQLGTSPVNLLVDPGFALVEGGAGYGSFLALYDGSFESFGLTTSIDSRSPAGFGGAVAVAKGMTDKSSLPVLLLTSVLGGTGPFRAQVWVSKSDVKGNPVEIDLDEKKGVSAAVTDETPDGKAYKLVAVPDMARTAGGRTWTLLRVTIPTPLAYGAYFVIRTGTGGGSYHFAAPEVVAQPLVDGMVDGMRTAAITVSAPRTRAIDASERAAITKYKNRKPRLVPATGIEPRRGL